MRADIVIVAPPGKSAVVELAEKVGASLVADPGSLPGAINAGAATASMEHAYVNWLGDDDLLTPGSLEWTVGALDANPGAVLAYGACQYISDGGQPLWVSRAGHWAERILIWGPDLIPQPGMLMRIDAWRSVGGLDESFRFAFDLDLLLKLRSQGGFVSVPDVVSDGKEALLVPVRDVDALTAAVERVIIDADVRHRLGTAAHQRASTLFGAETSVGLLVEQFHALAKAPQEA